MTAAYEVSAAREPIGIAEERQQLTSRLSRRLRYIRTSMPFLDRKELLNKNCDLVFLTLKTLEILNVELQKTPCMRACMRSFYIFIILFIYLYLYLL